MTKTILIFASLLFVLFIRFCYFYSSQPKPVNGQKLSFEAEILSQPQIFGSQQSFSANYKNQKVKVVANRFPEINYGDFVAISGDISSRDGRVLMYFPKMERLDRTSGFLVSSLKSINFLRQKIISIFSVTLPSPSSSLLLGIIFGIKEQMPKNFTDNLRTTGVFHVIAASGMNVTLIGGFISQFLAFFLHRRLAIGLSILGIVFYAILAGLEPSIIRASIMGIIVFSAQIIGRQSLASNSLFLTGAGMLFIDPSLFSDVGFQLSFTATAGILYIKPLMRGKGKGFASEILTTIAAQIGTLPILLANFGIYSIFSILVNGLVLWTIPILMVIGGAGAILSLIFLPLGQILIGLCYPLLFYFEAVVNIFGRIGGVITIERFPWQFTAGYYCLLASILALFKRRTAISFDKVKPSVLRRSSPKD